MSYFSGAKLRKIREAKRLSMSSVYQMTGVSVSSISNIETGKTDPRMSTITQLLSCYGASLRDLESVPPPTVGLDELKQRSQRAATDIVASELGPSNPEQRLAHKSMRGVDTSVELDAIGTRR
jgi:transcriptional regulator with XRE-family HTH domain